MTHVCRIVSCLEYASVREHAPCPEEDVKDNVHVICWGGVSGIHAENTLFVTDFAPYVEEISLDNCKVGGTLTTNVPKSKVHIDEATCSFKDIQYLVEPA